MKTIVHLFNMRVIVHARNLKHFRFVALQWVPEITHHCQKTPFLLVGTQIDLRDDQSTLDRLSKNRQKPISCEMGEKLAKELRAVKYVECSALTQVSCRHCVLAQRRYLECSHLKVLL